MSTMSQALRVKHLAEVEALMPIGATCTARSMWERLDKWSLNGVRDMLNRLVAEGRAVREVGPTILFRRASP